MRRAIYSAKKVFLPNTYRGGSGVSHARPGYWLTWLDANRMRNGRVLGRIDKSDGDDCEGFIAVMALSDNATHAYIRWVNPVDVRECHEAPPRALLAWLTGGEWATEGSEVSYYIALAEEGITSERFIASRNDPDSARAECRRQYEIQTDERVATKDRPW